MNSKILSLACALPEADNQAKLREQDYRAALGVSESIRDQLVGALLEAEILETIAISLDDSEVLICQYDGEHSYEFTLIRSYS
jgi:hypothetical protein